MTTVPRSVISEDEDDLGLPVRPPRSDVRAYDPRGWTTPARIRVLTGAVLVLVLALVLVAGAAASGTRAGLHRIGQQAGPQVVATSDLYFALNDMDAQVANVLLVGSDQHLGVGRAQALRIYDQRRLQADRDLQQAAAAAGDDRIAAPAVRAVLDGVTRYEALAAQAVLADGRKPHPPAEPPHEALLLYRQATDLMKSGVLPAAARLIQANASMLDRTYRTEHAAARHTEAEVAVLGVLLLATLLALQILFARRTHRMVNPALAAACVLAAVFAAAGVGLFGGEAGHLRVAKKDAFDSVLALTQARAISYDANADESRFLVDPERAARYRQAFLEKSQRLALLPGADLRSYDDRLEGAVRRYQGDHRDIPFGGFYGRAFHNITFPGERERAEKTLELYRLYQLDDRVMRAKAATGNLRAAVEFNTGYAPGNSNHDFTAYDQALASLTELNQRHFDASIRDGRRALRGWNAIPPIAAFALVALVLLGVRPRLAEYRA